MPKIKIEITINAPRKIVFDLARSIDFHLIPSTTQDTLNTSVGFQF